MFDVIAVTQAILPLLIGAAAERIVNVSSGSSWLTSSQRILTIL
ncbi:hypothetical protein ACIOBL_07800 [Paenibacillus taichungensis]|nr:hypothetical protein [Paenibacillus tundrae]